MRLAGVGLAAACMVWPCGALETKKRRYRSDSPWWYAQRFVFSGDRGVLRYETETRGLYMLLYLEEDFRTFNGINAASYASSTMEARFNKAHSVIWLGEGPDLRNATAAQTFAALGGGNATDETVKVKGSFEYTGSSMRWFYVVFANFDPLCNRACRGAQGCNLEYAQRCYGGVDVHVKLKLHNDGLRYREFSYDEASIFEAVTMIFALYVILCVAGAVVAALLLFRNKCHPVCSLLLAAIGLSALSQLLFMIHYATYTVDGRGLPKALAAAFYVAACADTLMCAVCILCAQGYNIVRRKLRGRTRMHVAIFSTTYVVANICVVAWHSLGGGAKGTSIFLYDSPSGYLFLFLRCLTAIWILRAAIQMQAHFRAKAGFYYRFCIVAATWVCAAPFVALVASLSPESERLKVSMVLEPAIVLLSQVGLLFLFTPLRILNEHFPFHSETTKQLSAPILGKWKDERVSVAAPGGGGGGGFGARLAAASEAAGGPVDTRSFAAISGGRGRGVDSRGRYVVSDGFEALHVLRLKRVQAALETRLAPLGDLARQLLEAMEHIDVDTVYDDEDDDDDGEGDGRRSEDSHGALHLTAAPLKQAPPLKRSFGAPRPPAHSPLALASAAGRAHRGDGRRGYNADADSSFEGEAKHQAAPSPDRSLESPERRSMASSPDTPRSPLLETDVDGGASHFGDGAFSDDGGGDSSPAREPPPTRTTPRVLGGGTRVLGGGARVLPPL